MAIKIRHRSIDWPSAFWERAEESYADNDLVCGSCQGRGVRMEREDVRKDTPVRDVVCHGCRGSGLLVRAREPGSVEAALAADEAGGAWLDFLGHKGDGLVWPLPCAWTISGRRFAIQRDVYLGGPDVLAYMSNREVMIGLYKLDGDGRGRLEAVFGPACGEAAEMPTFVMPWRSH